MRDVSAFQSNCHVQTEQLLSEALTDCPFTVFGITAGFLLYIWIFTTYVSHVSSLVAKARKRKRNQQTRIFHMSRSPTQEEKAAVPAGSQMEGWQTKVRVFPYGKQSLGQVSGNQNWRLRATKQDPTTTLCIWEGSSWNVWPGVKLCFCFCFTTGSKFLGMYNEQHVAALNPDSKHTCPQTATYWQWIIPSVEWLQTVKHS